MTDTSKIDTEFLDGFFDAAKSEKPALDDTFLARLQADALAAMPAVQPKKVSLFSGFRELLGQFGGWPTGASLATALVAGVLFGTNPPEAVLDITTAYFAVESLEELSGLSDMSTYVFEES